MVSWTHPTLWRVVIVALIVADAVNVFLWPITRDDDTFANIIAVASGVAALALILSYWFVRRFLEEALLLTFAVWIANTIEFATEDLIEWEQRARQCGFYVVFAFLALGAYVAKRVQTL